MICGRCCLSETVEDTIVVEAMPVLATKDPEREFRSPRPVAALAAVEQADPTPAPAPAPAAPTRPKLASSVIESEVFGLTIKLSSLGLGLDVNWKDGQTVLVKKVNVGSIADHNRSAGPDTTVAVGDRFTEVEGSCGDAKAMLSVLRAVRSFEGLWRFDMHIFAIEGSLVKLVENEWDFKDLGNGKCSLSQDKMYYGDLAEDGQSIMWTDGDVWQRVEDPSVNVKIRRASEQRIHLMGSPGCSTHGLRVEDHDLLCLVLAAAPEMGSPLAEHNESEPEYCLMKGDCIMEVNGVRGSPGELMAALEVGDSWEISFRRIEGSLATSGCVDGSGGLTSKATRPSSETVPPAATAANCQSMRKVDLQLGSATKPVRTDATRPEEGEAAAPVPPEVSLEERFKQALQSIKATNFSKPVPSDRKLAIYGLYKQATEGDNGAKKPGMLGGVEGRYKWDAWNSNRGKNKSQCQQEYIDEFEKQKAEFL